MTAKPAAITHVDVLIVGAGISGIGAACHLTREAPRKSYVILERRHAIGGTWDLFRYPGIRSDSDMSTFGYNFRPWTDRKVLADGASIRAYVEATADEYRVRDHITFGTRVLHASWSSSEGRWTVSAMDEASGRASTYTCSFLLGATGYYNYDAGFRPEFAGEQDFTGTIVHPQHWPEDLDYAGKKVVVIGSGATAVTLVPAMADSAEHVTMLQRSPTYIIALPAVDKIAATMRRFLPEMSVYRLSRIRNIGIQRASYAFSRRFPDRMRKIVLGAARRQLGPDADLRNFTPSYNPWDQRLCVVPDGDLFRAIRQGKAEVVTDTIETFTASGIRLSSGRELEADIVVCATGLQIQMLGGATLDVDGHTVSLNELLTYKGVLIENVPNAAMIFGYTNASWTLKADIAAEYAIRLMKHMDSNGYRQVVARAKPSDHGTDSILGSLASGYVRRGNSQMPRQGTRAPWIVLNNYMRDAPTLRRAKFDDGLLEFARPRPTLVKETDSLSPERAG
jgi:cation diffusion facilitator CzcD-associated flavoprotein CzcO